MGNALDAFRAQQEAAEQVHARLVETCRQLQTVQEQVNALTRDRELAEFLRHERDWLLQFDRTLAEVRQFREMESRRFWPGVVWRWLLAFSFALMAAWSAGAGYVWASRPYVREIESLRVRAELFDVVAERVTKMTPAQRRQFEALLR
jgi:hypothetical protein